jgi:replicative DNA helicase
VRPDANLEADVLAAALHEPERYGRKLLTHLEVDDFTTDAARAVFSAIASVAKRDGHEAIAPATVRSELRRMGHDERDVVQLLDPDLGTGAVGSFEPKCRRLREIRQTRFVQGAMTELMQRQDVDPQEMLDSIEEVRRRAVQLSPVQMSRTFADVVDDMLAEIEYDAQHRDDRIKTGLPSIDSRLSGGLAAGWLVVIGARTGVGKTMFATQIAALAARNGKHIVYVTIEESETRIAERITRYVGRVGRSARDTPFLVSAALTEAVRNLSADIVHLPDLHNILGYLNEKVVEREGVAVVFVDYAGLVRAGDFESKVQEIAAVTQTLKLAAMELALPIVLLAQINRQPAARMDKRPTLTDLRDSGSLEQDADIVFLLHHDQEKPEDDLVRLAKNRYGPPGDLPARFDYPYGRIEELQR